MALTERGEMPLQRLDHGHREHRDPILLPFPAPDDDLMPIEIHVLHPQLQAFLEAEAGSVE
jgi:hypothetical protein